MVRLLSQVATAVYQTVAAKVRSTCLAVLMLRPAMGKINWPRWGQFPKAAAATKAVSALPRVYDIEVSHNLW